MKCSAISWKTCFSTSVIWASLEAENSEVGMMPLCSTTFDVFHAADLRDMSAPRAAAPTMSVPARAAMIPGASSSSIFSGRNWHSDRG